VTFGLDPIDDGEHALWVDGGRFTGRWGGAPLDLGSVEELRLPGAHSRLNALAAAGAALACGVPPDGIEHAIADFTGVPNRLEHVAELDEELYVNDSAATAPAAALAALRAFAGRDLVVIAGGSDKLLDLRPLADGLARAARQVVLLDGAATPRLAQLLRDHGQSALDGPFGSMTAAVAAARAAARPGSIVLLSPGCASFGLFRDEFDRGDQFRKAVSALCDRAETPA
jgi:UDP-N-acetylmuramoylalanine--D-glutamate ligase